MADNTAPQPTTLIGMQRTIGRTGLRSYGGIIHEQELPQLQNVLVRMRIFREMRLDLTIGILEQAITRVLLAADFATVPAGNTPADQYAADLLLDIMNNMSVEWYEHVEDALEHLWFGFAITQIVLKQRSDGNIGLADLMPMGQEMTFRWGRQDSTGAISGVEMLDPVTGSIYKLPAEKFLHFTDRGRKRNPEGEGMCLHVWRSWRFMTILQELEAIGIERDVGGMPVFTTVNKPSEAEKSDILEQAKAMRQDEEAGLILYEGTTVAPYQSANKMYDVRTVIENYAWEILAYAGAQWLKLGEANGTQALVQGTTDMFGLYLRAIQERLLSVWHKQLVPTLAMFNPRLVTPNGTPKITWADPGVPDVKAILETYSSGVNSGVITPVTADEVHIRSILDLPELPDGVRNDNQTNQVATDILSQRIADLQFREQPMEPPKISDLQFSKQTPEAELKELEDFAKSKGITVSYVGEDVLKDYDGMNWMAAKELDWDEPWPEKTIAINQSSDTETKLHTLRHELNESYLMEAKGDLYGPAHENSLTIESKPNQYIYDLMQAVNAS